MQSSKATSSSAALTAAIAVGLCVHAALAPLPAAASCNAIPAAETSFISTLGSASTPFAQPGDEIVVLRNAAVFAADPAANETEFLFEPGGGGPATLVSVATALPPSDETGSECTSAHCDGELCRCLRLRFPDTDAEVGEPDDGLTLTGPVRIEVRTAGETTAVIGPFAIGTSPFADDLFPSFVALPPANRFADLLRGGGSLLAAADAGGNLLVPMDFDTLVAGTDPLGVNSPRTRFVEALLPALGSAGSPPSVDSFTPGGERLPPLVRSLDERNLLGTIDVRYSVLRVAGGLNVTGLSPEEGRGPIRIPDVSGFADPRKRADSFLLAVGSRYAVYENRECNALGVLLGSDFDCVDLNDDGDRSDYFLQALDLKVPRAEPITIDEMDGAASPGYPDAFPQVFAYVFDASEDLVAFRVPEFFASPVFPVSDIDGDGATFEVVRSGVFDLRRRERIPEADGSLRQEVAGSLAAFTVDRDPPFGPDELLYYDADRPELGALPVADEMHAKFPVSRTTPLPEQFPTGFSPGPSSSIGGFTFLRTLPFDIAVNGRQIAFVVPEWILDEDLTGDGTKDEEALLIFDAATGAVSNPHESTGGGLLKLTPKWLAYIALRIDFESLVFSVPVGLLDPARPSDPPTFICDRPFGLAAFLSSTSDSLIGCTQSELGAFPPDTAVDLNGDGDAQDDWVLHVFRPDADGGAIEQNLGLALLSPFAAVVRGDVLAVPVGEGAQGRDLNGDGAIVGDPFGAGDFTLHLFHGRSGRLINLASNVGAVGDPLLQFIDRGLVVYSQESTPPNEIRRTILRDFDHDGHFEQTFRDPETDEIGIADNCPAVANPVQEDGDGDLAGDACDLCLEVADPAQSDADDDRVGDACDVCPAVADASQRDADDDGTGDACQCASGSCLDGGGKGLDADQALRLVPYSTTQDVQGRLRRTDGALGDADPRPNVCGFEIALCLGGSGDGRSDAAAGPAARSFAPRDVRFHRPERRTEAFAAVRTALLDLPGATARGASGIDLSSTPVGAGICTRPFVLSIPRGTRHLIATARGAAPRERDRDRYRFRCERRG